MNQISYTVNHNTSLLKELPLTDTGGGYEPVWGDSTEMYMDSYITCEHTEEKRNGTEEEENQS